MSASQQAIQHAQAVLAKCSANDPWFPKPSQSTALAWAEHFQIKNYPLHDLLDAVTQVYATHGSGFKPLPGDILAAAAGIRNERMMREPDEVRELRQEERDRALEVRELVESADFTPKFSRRPNGPLSVACDFCGARPHSKCVYPGTHQAKPSYHPSRVDAARVRD